MSYIVARANNAKDWFTGHTLYKKAVGKSNGLEDHHIFPRAVLYKSGYDTTADRRIVNEVANRAFSQSPPIRRSGLLSPVAIFRLCRNSIRAHSRPRVFRWTQSCGKSRTIKPSWLPEANCLPRRLIPSWIRYPCQTILWITIASRN